MPSSCVEVIKFLSQRGLAFRGEDELFGSPHNGNYMGVLELLSKFDPFLADHISRFGNKGRGVPSYLSSTICDVSDELIEAMGADVLAEICDEVRNAKYFSLIIDSTADCSHIGVKLTIQHTSLQKSCAILKQPSCVFYGIEYFNDSRRAAFYSKVHLST